MSNTVADLLTRPGVRLAYVLIFEGCSIGLCTTTDTSGIATAMGDGRTYKGLLELPPDITREIDLLGFGIHSVPLTFELTDDMYGTLAALFAVANTANAEAHITSDLDRDDTTIHVDDTSQYTSTPGTAYHGHERFTFTGKTPTSFTGVTRGSFPFAGKSSWAHEAKTLNGIGPRVTSAPTIWKGRGFELLITALDPDTGTWVPYASMVRDAAGVLKSFSRSRDGIWRLNALTIEEKLTTSILRDQFQARVEGFVLDGDLLHVEEFGQDGLNTQKTISIAKGTYTTESLVSAINTALAAAGLTAKWSLSLANASDFGAVGVTNSSRWSTVVNVFLASATSGSWYSCTLTGQGLAMWILGFSNATAGINFTATSATNQSASVQSHAVPLAAAISGALHEDLPLVDITGTWAQMPQEDFQLRHALTGVGHILVEGLDGEVSAPWVVTYDAGGSSMTRVSEVNWDGSNRPYSAGGGFGITGNPFEAPGVITVAYGDTSKHITVRQVWLCRRRVSTLILRMLLSTGTSGYNDSTYDRWPTTLGCGVPSTLVDIASIEHLDDLAGGFSALQSLILTEPATAADRLESFLASLGAYLVWRGGKLTAIIPTHPGAMTPAWTLDSSNTGEEYDADLEDGGDLIRNQLTLSFNRDPSTGNYLGTETWHDLPSQSEHQEVDAFEIKADGLYDRDGTGAAAWRANVAAPFCSYFAHGVPRYIRSGARSLLGLAVGDIVSLSIDSAPDLATGTYGVDDVRAWVVAFTYSPKDAEFKSITLLVPQGRVFPLAPAAMLDYTRGDKGYDSANKRLYLLNHEFSASTEVRDAARWQTGDEVTIVEVDSATPAAARKWNRLVTSVGSDHIDITPALSSPPFSLSARYYVVPRNYAAAVAREHNFAYIGSGSALLIDSSTALEQWGDCLIPSDAGLLASSTGYYRAISSELCQDGAALSPALLRDIAQNLDILYSQVCGQQPISDPRVTAYTPQFANSFLGGPYQIYVPRGVEQLKLEFWAKVGTLVADTITATCSVAKPGGGDFAGIPYKFFPFSGAGDISEQSVSVTSTSWTKYSVTLTLLPDANRYCWISIWVVGLATDLTIGNVTGWFLPADMTR